ncbi:MAG: PIG-L family deacetylase [Bacteroidota bacterium]
MRPLIMLLSFCILLTASCSQPANEQSRQDTHIQGKVLMAIFAHPDDESTVAPILARYVREGVKVYLVIATDGRLGVNEYSDYEAGDGLAAVRREEMQCAASHLGVELIHLTYHDQLRAAEGYDGHMPQARALIRDIHQLFSDIQPNVLLTFGPDGSSNHMDHRLIGATVTSVFLSTIWEKTHSLYFYGTPSSLIEEVEGKILRGVDDRYMRTQISFEEEDLEAAIASISCHKSQFPMEGMAERMRSRHAGKIIFLRKFEGPAMASQDLFD